MTKTLIIFTLPFLIRIDVSLIRIGLIFYAMVEQVRQPDVVVPCNAFTNNQGGVAWHTLMAYSTPSGLLCLSRMSMVVWVSTPPFTLLGRNDYGGVGVSVYTLELSLPKIQRFHLHATDIMSDIGFIEREQCGLAPRNRVFGVICATNPRNTSAYFSLYILIYE